MIKLIVHLRSEDRPFESCRLPIRIGRRADSDLHLTGLSVSRNHARIEAVDSKVRLVDLSSGNGTFVNGEKVSSRILKAGDRLKFGHVPVSVVSL